MGLRPEIARAVAIVVPEWVSRLHPTFRVLQNPSVAPGEQVAATLRKLCFFSKREMPKTEMVLTRDGNALASTES